MNLAFSLSCWVTSLLSAALAVLLVLNRNNAPELAPVQLWINFCLAGALWSLGLGSMSYASSQHLAGFWIQIHYIGAIMIPAFFVHFVMRLLQKHEEYRRFLTANYILALSGIALCLSGNLVTAIPKPPFRFYTSPLMLYNAFTIFFIGNVLFGHGLLIREYFRSEGHRRRQIQYLLLGSCLGFAGGSTSFFPVYNIPVFPYGVFLSAIYVFIVGYAIVRYQLMDIRIFIRRIGLILIIYSFLIILTVPLLMFLHQKAVSPHGIIYGLLGIEVVALSGILSMGPVLYAYFVRRSSYFHEHEMAGITHDLKSPLGNILGALEFLDNLKMNESIGEKEVRYLDMIRRNTVRLEEAVNNLLAAFKIPAKAEAFDIALHDLGEIVRSSAEEVRERIENKGLKINISSPEPGPMVRLDEGKIRQVLSNLLSNAIKYTKTGAISVSVEPRNNDVCVTVRDTGEGIPPDEVPRVFDRLFQGETSRRLKGSGLGLTIAKTWVEAHGGEIHAESDGPGLGSRFWFTLPR